METTTTTPSATPTLPPWEGVEQQDAFLAEVSRAFREQFGGGVTVNAAENTIAVPSKGVMLHMERWAYECWRTDPANWRQLLNQKADQLEALNMGDLEDQFGTYDECANDLRVRVVTPGVSTDNAVTKGMAGGLAAGLYYRVNDHTAMLVDRKVIKHWGISDDELLDNGLERTLEAETWQEVDNEDVGWSSLYSPGMYASAVVVDNSRSLPGSENGGAIVAMPTAKDVLVCPVHPAHGFDERLAAMRTAADELAAEQPSRLTDNMVWHREGYDLEPYSMADETGTQQVVLDGHRDQAVEHDKIVYPRFSGYHDFAV